MRGYRQTFRRHRLLFLLPPLLAAIAIGAISYSAPKSYESSAALWVDNDASSSSSLDVGPANVQAEQPSTAEQTVLNELLSTGSFDDAVVSGAHLGSATAASKSALSASVATGVVSTVPGPQVLQVTYTGSSPAVAHNIVQSLVGQLQTWTSQFGREFGSAAVTYNQTQETTAAHAVAGAKAAVNGYQRAHPNATPSNDQTYASLVAALSVATSSLNAATSALNQARAQAQGSGSGTTVRVIDQPSYEPAPVAGLKSLLMKVIGAGLAGLLISILAIVALTPGDDGEEWADDSSEAVAGLEPRSSLRAAYPPAAADRTVGLKPSGVVAASPSPSPRAGSEVPIERGNSLRTFARARSRSDARAAGEALTRQNRAWGIADQQAHEEGA